MKYIVVNGVTKKFLRTEDKKGMTDGFIKQKRPTMRDAKRSFYQNAFAFAIAFALIATPAVVNASGAAAVTNSFNSLKEIVVALVSSIGTIVLLWGFFEWGTSMQSTDGVMQSSAFKRIGGGLIMVLAPQLISAFVGG